MIQKVFAIYDRKAACYGVPFFMGTDHMAVRAFSDLANDVKSTVNKHPEDYALYYIGSYNDNDGELKSDELKCLVNASSLTKVIDVSQVPIDKMTVK